MGPGSWEAASPSPAPPALETERGLCRAFKHGQRGWVAWQSLGPLGKEFLYPPQLQGQVGPWWATGHSLPSLAQEPSKATGSGPPVGCNSSSPLGPTGQSSAGLSQPARAGPEPVTRACSWPLMQDSCSVMSAERYTSA